MTSAQTLCQSGRSRARTGDFLTQFHSDGTGSVSYTHDRMSRIKTVADVTGTRTFNYSEYSGLKLDEVSMIGWGQAL